MEKQPAKINYFFGKCYRDLGNTIKNTFRNLGRSLANCGRHLGKIIREKKFLNPIGAIKFGYWLALLILSSIISTVICIFFSAIHVVVTLLIMGLIYLGFSFLWLLDTILCRFRKIVSSCPQCQYKFALPYYQCPGCGAIHTKLNPSKYGILKRQCNCGRKLPTTFFNGRQKLTAICPKCNNVLSGGGFLVNISIPVLGGPSSGKTCYVNMAIRELEQLAQNQLDFNYEHIEQGTDYLNDNLREMEQGRLPQKTSEMRLMYYEFFFSPKKSKVRNEISLCDVGGEVYGVGTGMDEQVGYNFANGFLMVIDPLSIPTFRDQLMAEAGMDEAAIAEFHPSEMPISEIMGMLIKLLENMRNLSSKQRITQKLAVVFVKGDLPLIDEKIGETAVKNQLAADVKTTRFEVQNKLCEQFLLENDQADFINTVKSRFDNVQYFTCSALGHVVDGSAFTPEGVADPILWLIDKASPTLNFKKYWSAR